jgi:hypothetical protein
MKGVIAAIAIVAMLALASAMAPAERDHEWDRYCEMVTLWVADSAAGIAPEHRAGWPPYRGQCE